MRMFRVSFGSSASIPRCPSHVCFDPRKPTSPDQLGMSQRYQYRNRLALMVGERHVHHELALGRMTGNVPLTRRVLREDDTPGRESADIAIACLKFNFPS